MVTPAPGPTAPDEVPVPDEAAAPDGRSTRWADHREARYAELVRIARKTVHRQGPDASMDEIAAAAGTSKSIVYRYFTDKRGLQAAVAEAVVLDIRNALADALHHAHDPRDGLAAMIDVYLGMIESSPNVYWFVTRDGSTEPAGPLGHFLDGVARLVATPLSGTAGDGSGAWAAGAVGFVRGAGEWWLERRDRPGTPDRATLGAQVTAWLWAGPAGLATLTSSSADDASHPA